MKERPILFSAPMVRAILEGRKTQTRRVVKFPIRSASDGSKRRILVEKDAPLLNEILKGPFTHPHTRFCPHGKHGDQLWVREEHYRFGHWEMAEGVRTKTGRQKWKFVADYDEVLYSENAPDGFRKGMHKETPDYKIWHKRLARFMPRAFSRITLEITGIRVERLNEISGTDAISEGIEPFTEIIGHSAFTTFRDYLTGATDRPAINSFQTLWESINGPGSWDANPFVWVIEFKRVTE